MKAFVLNIKHVITLLTALVATSSAFGKAVMPIGLDLDEGDLSEGAIADSCERLIELEFKTVITDDEFSEGEFLDELVGQVTSDPVAYCQTSAPSKGRVDGGNIL